MAWILGWTAEEPKYRMLPSQTGRSACATPAAYCSEGEFNDKGGESQETKSPPRFGRDVARFL